jgi:hypothetical protein
LDWSRGDATGGSLRNGDAFPSRSGAALIFSPQSAVARFDRAKFKWCDCCLIWAKQYRLRRWCIH